MKMTFKHMKWMLMSLIERAKRVVNTASKNILGQQGKCLGCTAKI